MKSGAISVTNEAFVLSRFPHAVCVITGNGEFAICLSGHGGKEVCVSMRKSWAWAAAARIIRENEAKAEKAGKTRGWIGVDLDGTLAYYDGWKGADHIGPPIPPMAERVKAWLSLGIDVRIFTARVAGRNRDNALPAIHQWCQANFGKILPVTCEKDFGMVELWDDRAVQVEQNTGRRIDGKP